MSSKNNVLIWRISLMTLLYLLQGFLDGFERSIPIYLAFYNASWQEQGTFSWASYPFSFKIFWAPVFDSIYSHRFGRYQTWLIPIQLIVGIILLILSFYLEYLLINRHVIILTVIFFLLNFLISSQDIIIDGWSVSLFNRFNTQWFATCQCIGLGVGQAIGCTVLLIFEPANFANKYIREPLSLPPRSHGLFSLQQFILFWSAVFITISIVLTLMTCYTYLLNKKKKKKEKALEIAETKLKLIEIYYDIFKLLKKRCMQKLIFILLTYSISFSVVLSMTDLTLIENGVTRETIALLKIPLVLIQVLVPMCLSKIQRPLIWFARGYIPRLIVCALLSTFMFFTPRILHTSYFYPILIIFFCLNEAFVYFTMVTAVGFFGRISEGRIAGTYITLLAAMGNMGASWSTTFVLYMANWLPKGYAYPIEAAVCFLIGLIWIKFMWRIIRQLSETPLAKWHLKPSLQTISSSTNVTSEKTLIT